MKVTLMKGLQHNQFAYSHTIELRNFQDNQHLENFQIGWVLKYFKASGLRKFSTFLDLENF